MAAGESFVDAMQDESPAVLGDDVDVDPALSVDQLGPADVVDVPAAIGHVLLTVVIQADLRLVITHIDEMATLNPSLTMTCVLGRG